MNQKVLKSKSETLFPSKTENLELPSSSHEGGVLPPLSSVGSALRDKNMAQAQRVALVQQAGQRYGNRQVQRLLAPASPNLVSREIEDQFKPAGEFSLEKKLKTPKPLKVRSKDVVVTERGDYPTSTDSTTVMAMRSLDPANSIQRSDDDKGGPGAEATASYSSDSQWSLELEGHYENLLLKHLIDPKKYGLHLDLVLSPKFSFSAEKLQNSEREVSFENGATLLKTSWMSFWEQQVSLELSAFAKHTLLPELNTQAGGKAEYTIDLLKKKFGDKELTLDLKLGAAGGWTSHTEDTKKPGKFFETEGAFELKFSF